MRKLLIVAATVGFLGFTGMQAVSAHGGYYGYCGQYYDSDVSKNNPAVEKFNADTLDIRRALIVKRNELRALLNNDNADANRVAQLSGEIFDLETDLAKKAAEAGLTGRPGDGHGPDVRHAYGSRYGGRHLMGW